MRGTPTDANSTNSAVSLLYEHGSRIFRERHAAAIAQGPPRRGTAIRHKFACQEFESGVVHAKIQMTVSLSNTCESIQTS
jgi:hypothetical protein